MNVTKDIRYIGVNDRKIDLFEGQYRVPNGMCYNSYAIVDNFIAIMDTVDAGFTHEWLDNIRDALDGRTPDYLIVQHMEPDHSANILQFAKAYPGATIVSSSKAFAMMQNFFGTAFELTTTQPSSISLAAADLVISATSAQRASRRFPEYLSVTV